MNDTVLGYDTILITANLPNSFYIKSDCGFYLHLTLRIFYQSFPNQISNPKTCAIFFSYVSSLLAQVAPDVDPCDDQRLDKSYLYSKESAFDGSHLFWGPGLGSASSSHLQYWESVPGNGRLVMYLRDVTIDAEGPRYGSSQLEALRFTGQRSSYATVPHDGNAAGGTEDVQADQHFTWYMEVKPASSGLGQGQRMGKSVIKLTRFK